MPASIVFWDTDTQADFIYPDGKLYVPGAEVIIPKLKRLTEWASKNGVLVVASACAHHKGDPEFAQYPPHCLVGTAGQKKIPETRLPNALTLPNRRVERPQNPLNYQQIIFEKQQLDVFSNPNIEAVLARVGPVHEVILYGVVTEICVAYAGRGLIRRGYRLRVVTDAIRHLHEAKAQIFLQDIRDSGAMLGTAGELVAVLTSRPAA
jgi:nicotinamidase/pyrazinamidase